MRNIIKPKKILSEGMRASMLILKKSTTENVFKPPTKRKFQQLTPIYNELSSTPIT